MIALPGITLQSKIYESSASLVYRGIRAKDNRAVVAKVLKQDYPSPKEIIRYRQEYQITKSLNLEGVIGAYGQQTYQRTLVILLEDFGGESLEHWMRQQPDLFPTSLSNFLRLAINITDILGRIHAARVIHKDINPGNIVFNPATGVVKIIDFGIATRFNRTNPTFRSPHELEGTLAYLSPEQTGRMNRLLDYRTDFYSLGVTFYELLTKQLPFPTTNILELVHCHIAKQPFLPCELNAAIPKAVSDIVMKLMAKNAEDRYQSAWGIKGDLERCAAQLTETGQIGNVQLGLQEVSDQFHIPQKLYGREAEIAALLAAFERVGSSKFSVLSSQLESPTQRSARSRSSGAPFAAQNSDLKAQNSLTEMMLVSGYSGVGKSALVQELYKPITAKCGYFVSGKFDQFGRNIPYSAIAHALQKLVQQLLGEPDAQLQQWRSRLLTALGSNGQLIIDVIPEVELIIGKQPPVPSVGATEAENRFNRVFGQFIRVFCSKEHPLVIFLDDLQWIDSATIQLIELMLLDEQTQALFLIGAYRDNEVSSTHPLALALERLRQQGATLQTINLAPLTLEPLAQLVAETLHQNPSIARPLAELVLRKTEGNPFFVGEFLRSLYSENLLNFNIEQRSWQWNITQIEAQNITDNVVDLLLSKLKKLPEGTQQILQLAACIVAEFDLETLAIVCERSPEVVFQDLLTAIETGFIQPLSELDEDLLVQNYKFLHDRVQQAAYDLIDESNKQIVHLQIGRNLLKEALPNRLSDRLFEIVYHLSHGIKLITNQAERDEIARLNLMAGQKAKAVIAYNTAQNYLATGRTWLAGSSWQTNYELTLELYLETTEVAYLCGEFEQVESWAAIVLKEAETVLDSVKVYEVKIQTYIAQGQPLKAIHSTLQVLPQFGISVPEQPSQSDIQIELDAISHLFRQKSIEDLTYLPEMSEPDKLVVMRILSRITISSWIAAPDLMVLLVSRQVSLSIEYGNAIVSPFAYANFGLILCGKVGDIETGYKFGRLALRLLSHSNIHSLSARTLLIVNVFIIHWKEHIRNTFQPLLKAYHSGLETGDLEFVAYAAHAYCFNFYTVGNELIEVNREMTIYNEAICRIKQETALTWNQIFQQVVANLMDCSNNPIHLAGEFYNEKDRLPQHEVANDGTSIFDVYANKLLLCYLFSEYDQAVGNATIAEHYLTQIVGTAFVPIYYLYAALARLAIYIESSVETQAEILEKVAVSQEKMKQWAQYAPMNYLHKYHLVQAETARVLGQLFEAEEFYEQAIQGAKENEYLQEEALGYELAAKYYLARGREKIAQLYMKEARYCYERWGAIAKVKDLEIRYPQFFHQSSGIADTPIHTSAGTTSNTSSVAFDLVTVMKASQAISSEIELEQLLRSLMQILIENAGAQTGCLLLENAGEWTIEAACELAEGEQVCATQVLQSMPMANRLPESIIQYVIRTHESVILNNATCEGNFIHDPYIQHNQTQSIFCLPLLNQGKLVGVLYLENRLATGVFTSDRVSEGDATRTQVLHLLSAQAAIAIENAKLYSKLRKSESQMAQFLEAVPVAIAVVDADGRPYYANQRRIQLVGKEIDPAVTADRFAEVYQFYRAGTDCKYPSEQLPIVRALRGERITVDDMAIHRNDATIPIEAWATPVFDEQGNVAYGIVAFQDISERRRAERLLADYNRTLEQQVAERTAALQASEAELRALFASVPDPLFVLTAEGRVVKAVEVGVDRLYRPIEEQMGKTLHEIFSQEQADQFLDYIHQVLSTQQILTVEYSLLMAGKVTWFSTRIAPIRSNQVIWLARDITEQRNAALRERKRAEEASILGERNRMAREIHDTLAQAFTGILLHVGSATQRLTSGLEATQIHLEVMEKIDELARTGLAEARRSVAALRPQLLEEGTLQSALHRLVNQMRATSSTILSYESKGVVYSLPTEVENHLLRIGQEALTNAIKYAKAGKILVELVYDDAQCLLRIKDNGQGFGVGSITSLGGFGLLGMSERAEQIGAQLAIQSQPGQGTEIIVTVNREQKSP
ncbi:MAG: AAA family ATPase [Chroococcidiopsidaceae cyanobacterium CP_BM_ER_R8_30]|nr:AAA family ATPase [Chroococcidiopsidaceae cyanobacterium CP_BM_ER_R8_30]